MRELKKSIFGYPIYSVTTTFHYRKVGTPTVFEELLMSLATEFPQLKHNSVGQIANILKLDPIFVRHTLENMHDIGMINVDDFEDLDNLAVADLVLTEIGHQFYKDKKIPGRRRIATAEFYFNPLSQKYEKMEKSSKSDILLPQVLFPANEEQLLSLSNKEIPYQSWFDNDIQVEANGIEHDIQQESFQTASISLHIDDNYHLHIRSSHTLFNNWLETRSKEIIRDHILNSLLKNANKALGENALELKCEDNILSLVLADQESDMSAVKNAIPVKFSNKQSIDENQPALILDKVSQAILNGKHLLAPINFDSDGITQLFMKFDGNVFIEKIGRLACYFDFQSIDVPIKMLIQKEEKLISLGTFISPNIDTLIFMANFISEDELLEKMPEMNVSEAVEFHKKVSQTWGKKFMPKQWLEKISPISNEQQLKEFNQIFHHIPLTLHQFNDEMQSKLFDLAIKNEESPVRKIQELSELFQLYSKLKALNVEKLVLDNIQQDSLNAIQKWQNQCDSLRIDYPQVYSGSLKQISENLIAWREKVTQLFVISLNKVAVLDTNFIRQYANQLSEIIQNHRVILPKIVLDELDYQKEKTKQDIQAAEKLVNEKQIQYDVELSKISNLTQQIKSINAGLQDVEDELAQIQQQLKALREQEQNNGKE